MEFKYSDYTKLLYLIKKSNYKIIDFSNDYDGKSIIIRHDIDFSIDHALSMALLESKESVQSTYCFLLSSPFYNIFSRENKKKILKIYSLGHRIGLHFDSTQYESREIKKLVDKAQLEKQIFENIFDNAFEIDVVSFHRPDKRFLGKDILFNNMINSYSSKFFNDYKYLSDSRMEWKDDLYSTIESGNYSKIQILIHPIWYSYKKNCRETILKDFIKNQAYYIVDELNTNFNLDKFSYKLLLDKRDKNDI